MRKFDLILGDIYNSEDYCNKGSSVRVLEQFFVTRNNELYLVLVMAHSGFDGEIIGYNYSIYSITKKKYIDKTSEIYNDLVSSFPELLNVEQGGCMSFLEKRRLTNMFLDLFDELYDRPEVNDGVLTCYYGYLDDMYKMKSASFQKIYAYFKEAI